MLKKKITHKVGNKYNAAKKKGFLSNLEVYASEQLKANGILFDYEPRSYTLTTGFNFCSKEPSKTGYKDKCIGRPITYKPDFICVDETWFLETKGMITEPFQIRWKLFKKIMAEVNPNALLIIARNKKDVDESIHFIKKHLNEKKTSH